MKKAIVLLLLVVSVTFGDNIDYKRVKTEKINSTQEIVWLEAGSSDNLFFRLGNGFSKKTREIINPMIDKLQASAYDDARECKKSASDNEYNIHSNLSYSSSELIGFSTSLFYDCGGSHPDHYTTYTLIDAKNGRKYKLKDILSIPKDFRKIRDLAFSENKKNIADNEYNPSDLYHWENLTWELRKDGIRFYLNFSTSERSFRGDYYEISLEKLKPYLSNKFLKKLQTSNVWVSKNN